MENAMSGEELFELVGGKFSSFIRVKSFDFL
jgi:hypothetical protein